MQIKNINRMGLAIAAFALLGLGSGFTSCNNDDDNKIEVNYLEGYGPLPIGRGETLTFLGKDLSAVQYVEFQNGTRVEVTHIDKTKFTIVVPNDVAPGVLKLILSNGTVIETVTPCKFTEPIELISAEPSVIKVGQELTITGKYLYQARSVKFAGDVVVSLVDTLPEKRTIRNYNDTKDSIITVYVTNPYKVSQDDGKIVVKVPGTALSGKVGLNDIDDNDFFSDDLVLDITAPKVPSFEDKIYKQGIDKINLAGTDLDLVKSIRFDGAEITEFEGSESAISFTLPATVKSGEFSVVTESGVSVPVADIKVVEPKAEVAEKEFLGKSLTITGTDLDFIKEVKVGAAVIEKPTITPEAITFVIPDNATDGITLTPANGKAVELKFDAVPFVIDEDQENQINNNAGTLNTIVGENLQYLKSVVFNGLDVAELTISDDGTSASYKLPSEAAASAGGTWTGGGFVATASNGETVVKNTWANACGYACITSMPSSIVWGNSILVKGYNLDKVSSISVNGINCEFSAASATAMFIEIPKGDESIQGTWPLVINDGSTSTYNKIKVEATKPVPVDKFALDLAGNDISFPFVFNWSDAGNKMYLYGAKLKAAGVVEGSILKFYKKKETTGQIQINDHSWAKVTPELTDWNGELEVLDFVFDSNAIDLINNPKDADGGDADHKKGVSFIIQGDIQDITKIEIVL
ncbi:MAG: hypothetical protein MJZ61_08640 [Bacteroidales bacterium]|nr:hypothetical protein [Bacteroidales bacterium]